MSLILTSVNMADTKLASLLQGRFARVNALTSV
jgi:hypothetical protein